MYAGDRLNPGTGFEMYAGARPNPGTGFLQIVAGRSGSVISSVGAVQVRLAVAVRLRYPTAHHDCDEDLLRAGTGPVIDS